MNFVLWVAREYDLYIMSYSRVWPLYYELLESMNFALWVAREYDLYIMSYSRVWPLYYELKYV